MTLPRRERRSTMAAWGAWLSGLSIPVLAIAAVGHRARLMDAVSTYSVMAVGFALGGAAVVAAIGAFAAIWRDGRKGVAQASRALVIGLAVLSVPAVGAWRILVYPPLTDVSTDPRDPPAFLAAWADRSPDDAAISDATQEEIAIQEDAYPDIVPRYYPVSPARVYDEAKSIVVGAHWQELVVQPPTEVDGSGRIEAVATTLLFGFRHDIAIVVAPDGEGSLVHMRSAARSGAHDLGVNAERIRTFLAELDEALRGVSGD